MGKYLALDMGAESGRIVSVEVAAQISTTEIYRFPTPVVTDDLGRRCWDFKKIKESVLEGLREAAKTGPYISIGVDTWGLDFGLLDSNQKLIGNPVSHRDHRTDGYLEKAAQLVGLERLHNSTGSQLLEINSIYQLLAMTQKTPSELATARHLLMMPDLVLFELTGRVGTEYTIASTTGLYNVFNNTWDLKLAADLGIPTHFLGKVEPAGTSRGQLREEIVKETGINQLECIASASHDTASAVVATPFDDEGSAFISSGTWSLLGVELKRFIANDLTLRNRLTNEGGYEGTNRLLRNVMGLWLIQEVRRDYESKGETFTYAQLVELAKKETNPWRTLIFVDATLFVHAGDMIERIQRFARATNQPIPETPGEIAQTIFASLALQYAMTSDVLEKLSETQMKSINIVGGGSQNDHLSQLTANVSRRRVTAGPVEATAMGNAIVQAIANGEIANLKEGRDLIRKSALNLKHFEPKSVDNLDSLRDRYEKLTNVDMK
jgi:rhamnulokinase